MNYVKPEVALLASASSAIQGDPPKAAFTQPDSVGDPYLITVGAYEADE